MKKGKVLVFSDCYIYGGSERLMSFLMNNEVINHSFDLKFAFRGFKSYIDGMKVDFQDVKDEQIIPLTLLSNETLFYRISCLNIHPLIKTFFKLPFFIFEKLNVYSLWNLVVFIALIRKERPDIIHVNNGGYPGAKSCNVLVFANYLTGHSKLVYQVNNQALAPKSSDGRNDRFINEQVNSFLTASHQAKQKLIDLRKFSGNKIAVINNCIIPVSVKMSKIQICRELNIPGDTFIITQVAFLTKRKGQSKLIKAMDILFKAHPLLKEKIKVILIGDGEDHLELVELARSFQLENNILFLGFKQNSQDYIAASDLFILPSISNEDMPLVILTALQLGKPVIASSFAGIAQAIQTEKNGLLIDLNEETFEKDISDSIDRVYHDDIFREKIGFEAKKSFENYTPEKYGESLRSLYFGILEQ